MKRSKIRRQPEPITVYHIYGPNSKTRKKKTGKIQIGYWNMTSVHSGINVHW